jgi:heptaprenyl diphosphate synthase
MSMPAPIDPATKGRRREITAALAALCLLLSVIEQMIPRPAPFFRIGLSNMPVLAALDFMSFGELSLLMALKVLGQALLTGTLASYVFLFSAAGSLASLLAMAGLKRLLGSRISLIGLGTAGALASNLTQAALSIAFIFGPAAAVIAPVLLGIGTLSGALMGAFAQAFKERSRWLALAAQAWEGRS